MASVLLVMNETGKADANKVFADQSASAHTVTNTGSKCEWDTAIYKSAMDDSVLFNGTDAYLTVAESTDFEFGTGDWCVEGYFYPSSTASAPEIWEIEGSYNQVRPMLEMSTGGNYGRLRLWANSVNLISTDGTYLVADTWTHVSVVCRSRIITIFINGTAFGTTYDASLLTFTKGAFDIGYYFSGAGWWKGNMCALAVYKGTLPRGAGNFTPPTIPISEGGGTYYSPLPTYRPGL